MEPRVTHRADVTAATRLAADQERAKVSGCRRTLHLVWNTFLGMVFCQSFLTSILVIGWTHRWAQRIAIKEWWKRSGACTDTPTFEQWANADLATRALAQRPQWIRRDSGNAFLERGPRRWLPHTLQQCTGSFAVNGKLGVQGIFNTWVVTLPGCLLWLFAWYDGWNNSFHKGYEQAAVGPLTGLAGVLLFMAAMLYLPMAQARQSVTGKWRSFYHFRVIVRLIRLRWVAYLGLAMLYALLSVPVMLLKTLPAFLPQLHPPFETLSAVQAEAFLKHYFFWCALLVFPVYVWLRQRAARIYARGVEAALQRQMLHFCDLSEVEQQALQRLGMARPECSIPTSVSWLKRGSVALQTSLAVAILAVVWCSFVVQIFVSEFFNYHPLVGWLNQPLVQLPWFRYLP